MRLTLVTKHKVWTFAIEPLEEPPPEYYGETVSIPVEADEDTPGEGDVLGFR